MPSVYFISDLHLGHQKICSFREGFGETSEEHDEIIIERINQTVRAKDKLYILGDVSFNKIGFDKIIRINCKHKELVLGNHDSEPLALYLDVFERVCGFKRYKGFWLSHAPIHPEELRGNINIHGHVHNKPIKDSRYISVCVEACDGYPLSIDEIREVAA